MFKGGLTTRVRHSVPARLHLHQKIHPFQTWKRSINYFLPPLYPRRFHACERIVGRRRSISCAAINRETVVRNRRRWFRGREAVSVYVRRIIPGKFIVVSEIGQRLNIAALTTG